MIHDGTHNVGPGKRRMCECCGERPAKVGFMCSVCYGIDAAKPPLAFEPIRRTRTVSSSPTADAERTKWRRERLGLPADTSDADVDDAWRDYRARSRGASWLDEPVTLAAEDS